jgi:hypothetical protein
MPILVNKLAPNSSNQPHSNAIAFGVHRALGKIRAGIRAILHNLMQYPMQN